VAFLVSIEELLLVWKECPKQLWFSDVVWMRTLVASKRESVQHLCAVRAKFTLYHCHEGQQQQSTTTKIHLKYEH